MDNQKDQYQRVLDLLKTKPTLNQEQAEEHGIYHFRQRIHYLRQLGHDIKHIEYQTYKLQ